MYRAPIATYSQGVGEMPLPMLMAKYEETFTPDTSYAYDDFARGSLTDWTPDKNKFEHEEPRGRVNSRAGVVELRYYGHRGNADDNYRPEYFDGFHGDEDRDQRGINVEPDMKLMKRQADARGRFFRFSPDDCEQLTGGVRSETREIADQQSIFKIVRDRLKIFARTLDGRREGLRRIFTHESSVKKSVLLQSYGDMIKDYALNPQRRAVLISQQVLRDSRAYREETAEADFAVAKYTQICRRGGKESGKAPRSTEGDTNYGSSDGVKHYAAAGMLMSAIVKRRAQAVKNGGGDIDGGESTLTVARASAPFVRDLGEILHAVKGDTRAAESDLTQNGKNATPQLAEHLGRVTTHDGITPAHMTLAAEMMYKSVKPGGDVRKNAEGTTSDAVHVGVRESSTATGKTAARKMISGAKLAQTHDGSAGESVRTFNYKTLISQREHGARKHAGDMGYYDADDVNRGKEAHKQWRTHAVGDTVEDMQYSDNSLKDRRGGKIGKKYTMRAVRRDERAATMDDF